MQRCYAQYIKKKKKKPPTFSRCEDYLFKRHYLLVKSRKLSKFIAATGGNNTPKCVLRTKAQSITYSQSKAILT